jgi:hypothetical protein
VWCVSECDREASTVRRPWPTRAVEPLKKRSICYFQTVLNESVNDFDIAPCSCVCFYCYAHYFVGQSVCDVVSKSNLYGVFS